MSQTENSNIQGTSSNEPIAESQPQENQNKIDDLEHLDYVELDEDFNPNHEPTQEQIIEYALFLGMNLPEDEEFLSIAREGLKSPLPPNWKPCKNKKEELFYINKVTGQSQWHFPCDDICKAKYLEAKQKKQEAKRQQEQQPRENKAPFNRALYALLDEIADLKGGLAKLEDVAFQAMNKDYDGVPSDLLNDLLLDFDELYLQLSNAFSGSSGSYENLKLIEALKLEEVSRQVRAELNSLKEDIKNNLYHPNRNVQMMIILERLFHFHAIINNERELAQYIILREPNLISGLIDKTQTKPGNVIALDTPLLQHDLIVAQGNSTLSYPSYYLNRLDNILYNLNHLLDISLLTRRLLLQSQEEVREDLINAFYKTVPPRTIIKGNPYSMKSEIHRQIDGLKYDLYSIDRRAATLGRYRYPYPDDESLAYQNLEKLQLEAKEIAAKLDAANKAVNEYADKEANVVEEFIQTSRKQVKNLLSDTNDNKYNLQELANDLITNLKKSLAKSEEKPVQAQEKVQEKAQENVQEQAEEKQPEIKKEEALSPIREDVIADEEAIEPPKNNLHDNEPKAEVVQEVKAEEKVEVKPEVVEATPLKAKEIRALDTTDKKSSASTADFTNPSGNKLDAFTTPTKKAFEAGSPLIGNHYRYKSQGTASLSNYELNRNYLEYTQKLQRTSPRKYPYY